LLASRRTRNVISGKAPFGAFFFQPLTADGIGQRLDFEYSKIDGAPVQAVDSLCKIASATRALAEENGPAVLFEPVRIAPPGPDVSCVFDVGHLAE
jgi:hypothetical protein